MEIKSGTNGSGSELSAESPVIDKAELCIDHLLLITCLFFIHMEAAVDKCTDIILLWCVGGSSYQLS